MTPLSPELTLPGRATLQYHAAYDVTDPPYFWPGQ